MRVLSPIANAIVSVCALTGLGMLLGRGLGPPDPATPATSDAVIETVEDWDALVEGGTSAGPVDAPAVLVTFSDFQCPYCAEVASDVATLRREQPDLLRMVYRHFPLVGIHPYAATAALAAECAGEQGRFEAMHDRLYERQHRIGVDRWLDFAVAVGVTDTVAFSTCVSEERYDQRIRSDLALGQTLGVTGTPTLYLNGRRLAVGFAGDALKRAIARAAEEP